MANAIVVKTDIRAINIDAMNRTAKASVDIANGTAVNLTFPTAHGDEVFVANKATSGMTFDIGRREDLIIATKNLLEKEHYEGYLLEVTAGGWMAISPEVNKAVYGKTLKGLDARLFVNEANKPFDVVKLEVGDIIQVSKDFFATGSAPSEVSGSNGVELTADGFKAIVKA
jgi:hypothetical protein